MRLSDWRQRAPHKDALTPKVLAVIEPILASLGAAPDPSCWIVWGEDPGVRYVMLVPTDAGLLQVLVRVNVPGEGPRASAKVIRWGRLQVGELGLETVSSHHLLGFQVESHILRGSDEEGDAIASFALEVFARIDGRPFTPTAVKRPRSTKSAAGSKAVAKGGGAPSPRARRPSPPPRGSQRPDAPALDRLAEGHARRGAATAPVAADDPLLGLTACHGGGHPSLAAARVRGLRAASGRPGDLLLQPPVVDRSVRLHGDAPDAPAPVVLRSEGGGHGRRRSQPPDALDRDDDPVQAGQERPARGHATGRHGDRCGLGRRDRGGGEDRCP